MEEVVCEDEGDGEFVGDLVKAAIGVYRQNRVLGHGLLSSHEHRGTSACGK